MGEHHRIDASNDPQGKLGEMSSSLFPGTLARQPRYDVTVSGATACLQGGSGHRGAGHAGSATFPVTSGAFTCTYSFTTGTFYSDEARRIRRMSALPRRHALNQTPLTVQQPSARSAQRTSATKEIDMRLLISLILPWLTFLYHRQTDSRDWCA